VSQTQHIYHKHGGGVWACGEEISTSVVAEGVAVFIQRQLLLKLC
jgi:hypothetical protein